MGIHFLRKEKCVCSHDSPAWSSAPAAWAAALQAKRATGAWLLPSVPCSSCSRCTGEARGQQAAAAAAAAAADRKASRHQATLTGRGGGGEGGIHVATLCVM
jgi:hypothetical protein